MLELLKKANPTLAFYSVYDKEFTSYGRVVEEFDTAEILAVAARIENPESGSAYQPSLPEFEALPIAEALQRNIFGELPAQLGYCWGHNDMLGATEWHFSSEINIAVTPLVLLLAHQYEIKDSKIDSSKFKAFYVPEGTVLEVYATSLHFCPCEVLDSGFGCVVGLPKGTNVPLEQAAANPIIFRKNKRLIAHVENQSLIERGVMAGITGENYQIKYR